MLCIALASASSAVWVLDAAWALAWHAGSWLHQPWVLWGASLVHLSLAHLLVNLAALAVLAVLGVFLRAGRACALAVVLAWPLGTLALACWPQVLGYGGMSGLLMAMLAVLAVHAALRGPTRLMSLGLFAVLALKLLSEHAWSQPVAFDPNWGFNVVYAAHLTGALAGAGCALVVAISRLGRSGAA